MIVDVKKVSEVREMTIAIVRFGPPSESDGFRAGEYYQVAINPYNFSPCGQFIRFGHHKGDEILGWQRADALYVVAELAKVPSGIDLNKQPFELDWGKSPALLEPPQ